MLIDVVILLLLVLVISLFWQLRKQSEYATQQAQLYCKQHQLQFLDIAWEYGRPRKIGRHIGWFSRYRFGFSSDAETRYEGTLELLNIRLVDVKTPPYRIPSAAE